VQQHQCLNQLEVEALFGGYRGEGKGKQEMKAVEIITDAAN